ncbi:MAG: serine protease [Bdellovibrionota bacterium]
MLSFLKIVFVFATSLNLSCEKESKKESEKPRKFTADFSEENVKDLVKIIGGSISDKNDNKWMIAIVQRSKENVYYGQYCGGVLVDRNWIISAAHCLRLDDGGIREADIVVGRHDLDENEGVRIQIKNVYMHPNYNTSTHENDIALLQLSEPVDFIHPIGLIAQSINTPSVYENDLDKIKASEFIANGKILGWGNLNYEDPHFPFKLHEANVPVVSNNTCRKAPLHSGMNIFENMICAGYPRGGVDTCQGDSGGPLVVKDNLGRWQLVGITSFGRGCAIKGTYGVYTRVSKYIDWISQTACSSSIPNASHISVSTAGMSATMIISESDPQVEHQLYYAGYSDYDDIRSMEISSKKDISVTFKNPAAHSVAVRPYKGICFGNFSNIAKFKVESN